MADDMRTENPITPQTPENVGTQPKIKQLDTDLTKEAADVKFSNASWNTVRPKGIPIATSKTTTVDGELGYTTPKRDTGAR